MNHPIDIPSMMREPCFRGGGRIEFEDAPVPAPGPGQLLIRVEANALCGSERGQFMQGAPVVPGHEAAGVVVAAGPNTHTAVGSRGVVFLMDFCGQCRSCRLGYTNQCLNKRADMGFNRDGGYAPYELVSETIFFAAGPDSARDGAEATLLLDIMGTGGHAISRAQRCRPDVESLLVAGAGPIGLGVLGMAHIILGPSVPVFISDVSEYRLKLAEQLGGLPINIRRQSLADGLSRHDAADVDAAIDTSGKTAARQTALDALGQRGVLVCVGHGEGISAEVSRQLIAPERAVMGSEYFRFDELAENARRLSQHRDYLSQIITHRFPLDAIQTAFETFFAGETGKVLIVH